MYVVEPIFAANVITNLTNKMYDQAYFWLALGFLQIFLRNTAWHINFKNYGKMTASMYYPIQNQIIDKILNAKDINFKQNSKEKMINILGTDIIAVSDFANNMTIKTAEFLRVIISLVIVFGYNFAVGMILVVISVFNFFILDKLNTNIATQNKAMFDTKDKISENFSDIVSGRELSGDLDVTSSVKDKYFSRCEDYIKAKGKHKKCVSYRDNWFYVAWTFLVFLITCYLIYLLSGNKLDLTLYLIIVPYLTSILDKTNVFFNIFSDLKNANISVMRLSTILNFTEKELIEFGNNTTNDIDGEISFNDVCFTPPDTKEKGYSELKHVSFHIPKNSIAVFKGPTNCGKRMIFHILRRVIKPTNGVVLINNIDIFEYQKSVYKENIAYVTYNPFFFDDTIINNLNMVEKNIGKIVEICKLLNIHDDIMGLPVGYDTSINKNLDKISPELQFMLGLARALLTGSEIVMIYELPSSLSANEKKHIKNTLQLLKESKTFLVFTANKDLESIADLCFEMDNGKCHHKKLTHK